MKVGLEYVEKYSFQYDVELIFKAFLVIVEER